MQKVKIQTIDERTHIFIGDCELKRVVSASYEQTAVTAPTFAFETMGFPEIEIDNADIRFRFTPETIEDAAKVICHTYKIDSDFRNAFIASVESAIYDDGTVCNISDQHELALEIANRIIGVEK